MSSLEGDPAKLSLADSGLPPAPADEPLTYDDAQVDMLLHLLRSPDAPVAIEELVLLADEAPLPDQYRQAQDFIGQVALDPYTANRLVMDSKDGTLFVCLYPTEALADAKTVYEPPTVLQPDTSVISISEVSKPATRARTAGSPLVSDLKTTEKTVIPKPLRRTGSGGVLLSQEAVSNQLTLDGVRIIEEEGVRRLYYRNAYMPLQDSTIRVLELVSLYPGGLEERSLHNKLCRVVGRDVALTGLRAHLGAIQRAFMMQDLPDWQVNSRRLSSGALRTRYQLKGALPKHPADWPSYFDGIRPDVSRGADRDDPEYWKGYAACRGMQPENFFDDRGSSNFNIARLACALCSVHEECANAAMQEEGDTQYRFGMYGLLTSSDRRKVFLALETAGPDAAKELQHELQQDNRNRAFAEQRRRWAPRKQTPSEDNRADASTQIPA